MINNTVISAAKANRLFWLGRYEERVYLTLHILRKCYDKMIDGDSADYDSFWQKLDIFNNYQTEEEFKAGMMFDENNMSSVISALLRAQDNAILLREDIMSETLSYIEMPVALMRRLKTQKNANILSLQPVTDWTLAFWGSTLQRVTNIKTLALMYIGRELENIDFLLRFDYPLERISLSFNLIKKYLADYPAYSNQEALSAIEDILDNEQGTSDANVRNALIGYFNQLVKV